MPFIKARDTHNIHSQRVKLAHNADTLEMSLEQLRLLANRRQKSHQIMRHTNMLKYACYVWLTHTKKNRHIQAIHASETTNTQA
eukprot:scaffold557718_cov23-Prasinocladus_malaysianus.AAC.1